MWFTINTWIKKPEKIDLLHVYKYICFCFFVFLFNYHYNYSSSHSLGLFLCLLFGKDREKVRKEVLNYFLIKCIILYLK